MTHKRATICMLAWSRLQRRVLFGTHSVSMCWSNRELHWSAPSAGIQRARGVYRHKQCHVLFSGRHHCFSPGPACLCVLAGAS